MENFVAGRAANLVARLQGMDGDIDAIALPAGLPTALSLPVALAASSTGTAPLVFHGPDILSGSYPGPVSNVSAKETLAPDAYRYRGPLVKRHYLIDEGIVRRGHYFAHFLTAVSSARAAFCCPSGVIKKASECLSVMNASSTSTIALLAVSTRIPGVKSGSLPRA